MTKNPTITFLDIESSPSLGWAWGAYDVNLLKIEQASKVISVAWKFLDGKETYCQAICDNKKYKPGDLDDKEVVKTAWEILDNTDVLVTQNGDHFDIKKLNTRFVYHGLSAPSTYKSLDTLKQAKKHFRFESNKLGELGKYLGVGTKAETGGLSLWFKCMDGDKKSWDTLKRYNKQDVVLLEQVYLKLRPYSDHPNLNLIANTDHLQCGSCLSSNIQKRGYSFSISGRKQRYQCKDCGSWSTGSYQRITKEEVYE